MIFVRCVYARMRVRTVTRSVKSASTGPPHDAFIGHSFAADDDHESDVGSEERDQFDLYGRDYDYTHRLDT